VLTGNGLLTYLYAIDYLVCGCGQSCANCPLYVLLMSHEVCDARWCDCYLPSLRV